MAWKFFTNTGAEKRLPTSAVNPSCGLVSNAAQSLANNTDTAMVVGTVQWDTDGMTASANKITIQHAGKYTFNGWTFFDANATGIRYVYFRVNGASAVYGYQSATALSAASQAITTSVTLSLNAGDYVEFMVSQNSGGALNVNNASTARGAISATKADGAVVTYVGVPGSLVGQELAVATLTNAAQQTIVLASEATPVDLVTLPAITADGTMAVELELFGGVMQAASGYAVGDTFGLSLWEGSNDLGRILVNEAPENTTSYNWIGVYARARFVPTAGSHTYKIRAWKNSAGVGNFLYQDAGAGVTATGHNPAVTARVKRAA